MKTQRKRTLPTHNKTVEFRIKQLTNELGFDKYQAKWNAIVNENKRLSLNNY